jgi:hypothetical protein
MCPHFGDVAVFVRRVGAVKVERMALSFMVVFPGFDVDVYRNGVRVGVFVGVLCGDYGISNYTRSVGSQCSLLLVYKY